MKKHINLNHVSRMLFGSVYLLYLAKGDKKGKNNAEADTISCRMTGYKQKSSQQQIGLKTDFRNFFDQPHAFNSNADKITGIICGIRVQHIEVPFMQKVCYPDKLIDETDNGVSIKRCPKQHLK
ncbi:MAG TPA: DUF2200 family protein [Bacteroidia bacterium]|nr:DUF2200 family protein [Bacteroidia bacterium]